MVAIEVGTYWCMVVWRWKKKTPDIVMTSRA